VVSVALCPGCINSNLRHVVWLATLLLARSNQERKAFGKFFRTMLDGGVYLPPSQYEAMFLGATHTEEDVQRTVAVAKQALAAVRA